MTQPQYLLIIMQTARRWAAERKVLMKSRLLVAAFGVPLVAVILIGPAIATTILISAISVMAVFELFSAVEAKERIGALIICSISAAGLQLAAYFRADIFFYGWWLFLFLTIIFALWVAYHERGREFCFIHFAVAFMSGILIPLCLSSLVIIRRGEDGLLRTFVPVGTAFICDAGALFTGMALGRHKLAPRTSPKKTVEGMLGGITASVIFMIVYGIIITNIADLTVSFMKLIVMGAVCGVFTQLGDLVFSLIKREFEIKDYGTLLPGHGGALDRFDSMVTVAPAALLMFLILRPF